jgi:hypothetical protein
MNLPEYFLPRPPFQLTPRKRLAFEAQLQSTPPGGLVDYCLAYPKWQYLSYLCGTHELVLHGSQNRAIGMVEPRQARDVRELSSRRAIYATTDGIWAMYFAILDRRRFPAMTLFNSCVSFRGATGRLSEPVYFFSITEAVRREAPWCEGMVYILPRRSFQQEPVQRMGGVEVVFPQCVGSMPVEPVARLAVSPADFPFLAQVHGHDDAALGALHAADPGGFPISAVVS